MTDEEAKTILKGLIDNPLVVSDYLVTALDMAIKALEQQTAEDCVKRDDAIRLAEQGQIQGFEWQFKKLCNLPSVQPQPKRGKWISIDATHSKCEKCEAIFEITSPNAEVNFCPSCGVLLESEMQI